VPCPPAGSAGSCWHALPRASSHHGASALAASLKRGFDLAGIGNFAVLGLFWHFFFEVGRVSASPGLSAAWEVAHEDCQDWQGHWHRCLRNAMPGIPTCNSSSFPSFAKALAAMQDIWTETPQTGRFQDLLMNISQGSMLILGTFHISCFSSI